MADPTSIAPLESGASFPISGPATPLNPAAAHRSGHGHGDWHGHGPFNLQKALNCPSLAFAPVYSEAHNANRQDRASKSKIFAIMSAGLPMVIGGLTAVCAWAVGQVTEYLGTMRINAVHQHIQQGDWVTAWAVHTAIVITFVMIGALPVIFYAKSSGSSGIPGVIALLNGCDLRPDFGPVAVLARLGGVMMAVSSGLAVGPEGPMIFIGAGIGAFCARLPSNPDLWRYFGRPPSTLNGDVYLRDYVAAGAGCGIAAAFKAPIAGTLFVIEEAASHFQKENLAKIFFAGIVALFFVVNLLHGEGLLEYSVTTGANCQNWNRYAFTAVPMWFFPIGVICGLAGALFNWLNIKVTVFRARHANPTMPYRRMLDLLLVCIVTSSACLILPAFTGEMVASNHNIFTHSNGCIEDNMKAQIVSSIVFASTKVPMDNGNMETKLHQRFVPKPCLYGLQATINGTMCHSVFEAAKDTRRTDIQRHYANTCSHGLIQNNSLANLSKFNDYCCAFDCEGDDCLAGLLAGRFMMPWNTSCNFTFDADFFPSFNGSAADRQNAFVSNSFNPMGGLSLVPLAHTARNLFMRGAPTVIPANVLAIFLVVFFVLAAVTAGTAIPSGLLLPQIIIGALIGRLYTLGLIWMQVNAGSFFHFTPSSQDSIWVAAVQPFFHYFGGPVVKSAALTETMWAEPGVGAILGAAAFLAGSGRIALFIVVMLVEVTGDPIIILPVGVSTVVAVVAGNIFNHGLYHTLVDVQSFPFLPDRWPKNMPTNMRIKEALPDLPIATVAANASRAQVQELLKLTYKSFPVVNPQGVAVGLAERRDLEELLRSHAESGSPLSESMGPIDVSSITDFSSVTVRAELPIKVAYELFKRMEMRRLIIVDDSHHPQAVLTRKTLLPCIVEEYGNAKSGPTGSSPVTRPSSLRPIMSRGSGPRTVVSMSALSSDGSAVA